VVRLTVRPKRFMVKWFGRDITSIDTLSIAIMFIDGLRDANLDIFGEWNRGDAKICVAKVERGGKIERRIEVGDPPDLPRLEMFIEGDRGSELDELLIKAVDIWIDAVLGAIEAEAALIVEKAIARVEEMASVGIDLREMMTGIKCFVDECWVTARGETLFRIRIGEIRLDENESDGKTWICEILSPSEIEERAIDAARRFRSSLLEILSALRNIPLDMVLRILLRKPRISES